MSTNATTLDERKRRLEAVKLALLVLSDGKDHSARELFERPENATRPSSGYKANLAWQSKTLATLHDLGLILRTGAHGPTRKYRLAPSADLNPFMNDESAATLIWETGILMLQSQEEEALETESDENLPDANLSEGEVSAEEDPPRSIDPTQALLARFVGVLEHFGERLKSIDARLNEVGAPAVSSGSVISGSDVSQDGGVTQNDLSEAAAHTAAQILQRLEPRLVKIEKQLANAIEVQLSLPAVDLRSVTHALDAPLGEIARRVLDVDGMVRTLEVDMKKQVNRTQDVATKQVVDKKRFDDFCRRIDELLDACDRVIGYNVRLITSLRVMVDGPAAEKNDAILSPLLKKERG